MGSVQQDADGRPRVGQRITILVTGFGPFLERFPINPSWEIAKSLPDSLPATNDHSTEVRIITYASPLPVSFNAIREFIPRLLETHEGPISLILHIGMASGRNNYTLERYARREGYTKHKDLDGNMPPMDEGNTLFVDCPQIMTPSLDFDRIMLNWQANILGIPEGQPGASAEARPSKDAGRYVCDYIYFNSLAHCGRRSGVMEGGKDSDRPVLFFHVPPQSDQKSLDNGRAVAIALIRAAADTIAQRNEGAATAVA